MKVLVTLDYYYPHWTGLTAYAKRIAEGLAARGHSVTVLASQHDRSLPRQELVSGVRVLRVPVLTRFSRGVVMPRYPLDLVRLLQEHDVVHVHTPMPEVPLVTGLARILRKPSVITHQGDVVMPAGFRNSLIQQADHIASLGFRMATRVAVHSADYGKHSRFLRPVRHKLDAIHPPADLPEPDPAAVCAAKRRLGLEGKRIVGFGGRWVEEKGFDYLLQAIPAVLAKVPNAHFVYAGETKVVYEPFFERCQPLLERHSDSVTALGLLLEPQDLADFYAMCDVFAVPSRTDCFPSMQLESLLSGTPLVTADIPGAREVVRLTRMGVLVTPRDPAALADGIIQALSRSGFTMPDREAVRSIFSPNCSIERYERLLLRIVNKSG